MQQMYILIFILFVYLHELRENIYDKLTLGFRENYKSTQPNVNIAPNEKHCTDQTCQVLMK